LNHFFLSFYLLFFSYMLYNSKWSEIFEACSQLALKNESKELPPFWTFPYTNVSLWSATTQFFVGPKKGFLSIQTLISYNLHGEKFWNFFPHLFKLVYYKILWLYVSRIYFFKNLVFILEIIALEQFWWKHSLKPLGVSFFKYYFISLYLHIYAKSQVGSRFSLMKERKYKSLL